MLQQQNDIFEYAPFFFNTDQPSYGSLDNVSENALLVPLMKNGFDSCSVEAVGVTLTWRDLSVFVPQKKPDLFDSLWLLKRPFKRSNSSFKRCKRVLNNVSGIVKPGTLLAIMGASGSGKTTLLNSLALRLSRSAIVDGKVAVNGYEMEQEHVSHLTGFVDQKDLFYETLTVREHLDFTAKLRLGSRFTREQIAQRVDDILQQTGLTKCKNSRIGSPTMTKSLSGGERKRLAFASEVIADPPLLFCDEPTSGLDYFMAQTVVGVLATMAANGKTVLCSIHQPSSEVFAMFNEVLLLADGRVAYMGPTKEANNFFDRMGYVCPPMFNPADFYVQTLASTPGKEEDSNEKIKGISDHYALSAQYLGIESQILRIANDNKSTGNVSGYLVYDKAQYETSWATQFRLLMWREMTQSLRNPRSSTTRFIQKTFIGLMLSLIYVNVKVGQDEVMDIMGIVFLLITENTYPSMYNALQLFHEELPLILREHKNGLYEMGTYYLTKILNLIPSCIVESAIFLLLIYWIIGLNARADSCFLTVLAVMILSNTASAFGCFFSAMYKDVATAIAISLPFDYIMMMTGGLFINIVSLPWYVSWAQYFSWFRYSFEAISIAQWQGVQNITCDPTLHAPCYYDGEEVLHSYGFDSSNLQSCFVAMVALYCGLHFLGYLALLRQAKIT